MKYTTTETTRKDHIIIDSTSSGIKQNEIIKCLGAFSLKIFKSEELANDE